MWGLIVLGAGLVIKNIGEKQAADDQAAAEVQNAEFYREQAAFAEEAGKRAQTIFDRESVILYGEQVSGLSNAGVGGSTAGSFLAKEALFRSDERAAIGKESDMNVRLAQLRAQSSDAAVDRLQDNTSRIYGILGDALTFGAAAYNTDFSSSSKTTTTKTTSTSGSGSRASAVMGSSGSRTSNYRSGK